MQLLLVKTQNRGQRTTRLEGSRLLQELELRIDLAATPEMLFESCAANYRSRRDPWLQALRQLPYFVNGWCFDVQSSVPRVWHHDSRTPAAMHDFVRNSVIIWFNVM